MCDSLYLPAAFMKKLNNQTITEWTVGIGYINFILPGTKNSIHLLSSKTAQDSNFVRKNQEEESRLKDVFVAEPWMAS
jgi:hypothetical protein